MAAVDTEISYFSNFLMQPLSKVLLKNGLPDHLMEISEGANYSTVSISGNIVVRLYIRKKRHYVSVPAKYQKLIPQEVSAAISKSDGYSKIILSAPVDECLVSFSPWLAEIVQAVIVDIPHDFDCCSRYMECSQEMRCVNPLTSVALGCGYRKILAKGQCFYGPNRNVGG